MAFISLIPGLLMLLQFLPMNQRRHLRPRIKFLPSSLLLPPLSITTPRFATLLKTLAGLTILCLIPTSKANPSINLHPVPQPAMKEIVAVLEDPEMGIVDLLASTPSLADLSEVEEIVEDPSTLQEQE